MVNLKVAGLAAVVSALAGLATAEVRGVSDTEIRVGSVGDLSGPLALWGVDAANGMKLRLEEANAAGGVHGRKITLLLEDGQYQIPLAVRMGRKLVERDDIFAGLLNVGTPQTLAVMEIQDKANVPNLFPLTAAGSVVEPLNALHFSQYVSYENQARGAVKYFAGQGVTKYCLQTVASDYGEEVVKGALGEIEAQGATVSLHGKHKTTEVDFAGAATAIKNADCEVLLMGTTIKDTITLYATLRKLGWDKPIVANMVAYAPLVAAASDGVTDGLYVVTPLKIADFGDGDPWRADFAKRYQAAFGAVPTIQSQQGYVAADLMVRGLENAGPELTVETLTKGLEAITEYVDPFGGPTQSYSATKHSGADTLNLAQSKAGGWVIVQENLPY